MAWADVGTNDFVTINNFRNALDLGIFTYRNQEPYIPADSNNFCTKSDVNWWATNLDQSYMNDRGNSDFVTKADLVAVAVSSYGFYLGWSETADTVPEACALTTESLSLYASVAAPVVGTALYSNSGLTTTALSGYYKRVSEGKVWTVNSSGVITAITACTGGNNNLISLRSVTRNGTELEIELQSQYNVASNLTVSVDCYGDISGNYQQINISMPVGFNYGQGATLGLGLWPEDTPSVSIAVISPSSDSNYNYVK